MNGRALAVLVVLWGACGQTAAPAPSRPWTMFDLAEAFESQERVLVGVDGLPGGLPYNAFVKGPGPLIPISSAFTEGGFSPYITTNVWANVREVWVQPMYILVSGFDSQGTHDWIRLKDMSDPGNVHNAGWVYTVGPKSRFHSPFWRTWFAVVPGNKTAADYTSSEQILRDQLPLFPGPGWLASIVPNDTKLGPLPPAPPLAGEFKAPNIRRNDYLDGVKVTSIDFGPNRFDWNYDDEVIEQPFFVLVTCRGPGDCGPSGAPNIGGTGPLFARRPAIAPGERPRFGSFWRLYLVALPAGDGPGLFIAPSVDPAVRETIAGGLSGLPAPPLMFTPDAEHAMVVEKRSMQVALNAASCFKDQASFDKCQWLDSQKAVEESLPGAITRTGITVTCPLVGYDGMDVKE